MKALLVIVLVLVAGCAETPERRELRHKCATEAGLSDARCVVKPPKDRTGQMEVCDQWGRCTWVNRDDFFRQFPQPSNR